MKNVIGAKLKEMGKTQSWLAQKTGLSRSAISDLVSHKTGPRIGIQSVVKITKAMGCTVEELFLL